MDRGVQYIQENYADPSLPVSSIAAAFHLSGKYLSQLFKEQTGSKISAFIEQKRIDLACRLLRSTTLSVSGRGLRLCAYPYLPRGLQAFPGRYAAGMEKVHGEGNAASSSEPENERG